MIENASLQPLTRSLVFAGLIVLGLAGATLADEPDTTDLGLLAERFSNVEDMQTLMNKCPTDIWKTRRNWRHWLIGEGKKWGRTKCHDDMAACGNACIDDLNSSACFAAARVFEEYGPPKSERFKVSSRQAFALTCALGKPSGCTNRGAGIRNSAVSGDNLSQNKTKETWICLRRTFAIACSAGNAWGCAMEGQALRLGEGGPVDMKAALSRFNRTCSLSSKPEKKETEFAPCRFARRQIDSLEERN